MLKLQQLIITDAMKKSGPAKINKDTTKIPTTKLVPFTIRDRQFNIEFNSDNGPDKGDE